MHGQQNIKIKNQVRFSLQPPLIHDSLNDWLSRENWKRTKLLLVVTADQKHNAETKTEEFLPNGEKANRMGWGWGRVG